MNPMPVVAIAGTLALFVSSAGAGPAPDDAQIAAIVVTANRVDIDAGKLAGDKASSPEVRKFAQQMVTDHTAVNAQATDLVTRLKVTPEPNPTSASLAEGGKQNLAKLDRLDGPQFDRAYVDHEVVYHEQVIEALDTTLIPNARNAELKDLLVKVRPAFVAHLQHARHLQSALKP